MKEIGHSLFSDFRFQAARQTAGVALHETAFDKKSSPFSVTQSHRDEYVPSALVASVAYKRSAAPANAIGIKKAMLETTKNIMDSPMSGVQSVQKADTSDKTTRTTHMDYTGAGLEASNKIFQQVFDEKEVGYGTKVFTYSINAEGVYTFYTDDANDTYIIGFDHDFAVEVSKALEDAFNNSSIMDIKENPHFYRCVAPTAEHGTGTHSAEPDFSWEVTELRSNIYKTIVDKYNEMYRFDPDLQITGFSMKIDDQGKLTITDVQTEGNDPKANARAEKFLNRWLTDEVKEQAEQLGFKILSAHDAEFEDVLRNGTMLESFDNEETDDKERFKHEILISSGFDSKYQILSPDADKVLLAEMAELMQDFGGLLRNFFGQTLDVQNPFELILGPDGLLSLGESGTLSPMELGVVKQGLWDMNRSIASWKAGEETEKIDMLSPRFKKQLLALEDVQRKIHDKSLLPKKGLRFSL